MVELEDLRNRNPRAWTLLITQGLEAKDEIVTAVGQQLVRPEGGESTRFLLSLLGYHEPLSLIGKQTNPVEALFYDVFAAQLPHFTPRCWFSHIGLEDGWLVLADVQNDHPPETWTAHDIEIIIGCLASLHAAYWNQREILEQHGLPTLLETPGSDSRNVTSEDVKEGGGEQPASQMERIEKWLLGQRRLLTEHAIRSAGPLAPLLAKASEALEILKKRNGWPGILDERHLTALTDLLDDPLPMLFPLRQLRYTLLHGNPSADHWHLNLFDDYYLLDWDRAAIGPGVYDLVAFIDGFKFLPAEARGQLGRSNLQASEESMIDSYILAMRGELGARYDARATRLAIPAARCLHVLSHWLPKMAEWALELPYKRENWQAVSDISDDELSEVGLTELVGSRSSLATIFDRFLRAYRSL